VVRLLKGNKKDRFDSGPFGFFGSTYILPSRENSHAFGAKIFGAWNEGVVKKMGTGGLTTSIREALWRYMALDPGWESLLRRRLRISERIGQRAAVKNFCFYPGTFDICPIKANVKVSPFNR